MAKAIFLTNPDLNIDDVVVEHSSALGRRAGKPIPASSNSGLMRMTAIGDSGDGIDRTVRIRGQEIFPRYFPSNSSGQELSTALETFTTMAALTVTSVKRLALVECYDRLHLVTVSSTALLSVYTWGGSAWTLRNTYTVEQDIQGGIAACARGDSIYIGICDANTQLVTFYAFNARSFAIREIAEGALAVNSPTAISIASDGAMFVFLHEYDLGGGAFDVRLNYGRDLSDLRQKAHSFLDMFDGDWEAQGHAVQPFVCFTEQYRYVAGMRVGTDAPGKLRFAHSKEGDDWEEFKDIVGAISYPTSTANRANAKNVAVAGEGRRLFALMATTSGSLDGAPTDLKMQYFNGRQAWSSEIDADAGLGVLNGTGLAIANWRGTIYGAWASDANTIRTRKWNTLSTNPSTDPGHSTRAMSRDRNFVDGVEDDSRRALWFTPKGSVQKDDVFTIPAAYDRRGANVLSEMLGETWRAEDGGEEWLRFDAGLDRAFAVDAIAIFGANLPELTLEMDDDPDFTSPPVSETIDRTIVSAAVVSGDRNVLTFAAGTFQHYQHAETTRWVKLTTGVSGIFRIVDNTADTLIVDGDVTGAGGTASIFGDRMWLFLDQVEAYRYLRLVTPEVELPDGYYEIARVIFGQRFSLPRNFSSGFTRQIAAIASPLELKSGSRLVTPRSLDRRHTFSLPWQVIKYELGLASLEGFYGRLNGAVGQMAFWPHPDSPVVHQIGMHLCRVEQPLQEQHLNARYFGGGLVLASEV